MFGPKLTSLFKNRWMALLWSAGIIWMAVSFVGTDDNSAEQSASSATQQDMAVLDKFLTDK